MADEPKQGASKKMSNIKVAVRCRPALEQETKAGATFEKLVVDGGAKGVSAWNERTNSYKNANFDIVIDQAAQQGRVFELAGLHDLVKHVAEGYHATVFAYGQTGSGKTYTMEGYKYKVEQPGKAPQAQFECGENEGIVPRSVRLLFDLIKQQSNLQKKKFTVYCSYLQVYKEKIYDLLNKSHVKGVVADGPGLKLKWSKNDVFSVENLYTFECKTVDDVMALYHFGIKNKVVASHNMNNSSSRSHSMLSLTVEQVEVSNLDNVVVSKLQLVDLAGSERQSQTGNIANKESIDINKSLFTLRQVITALTERNKGGSHGSYIPYRDSKLTCLLRQSLGGNSYCLMIACLNPCDAQIEENISTMQYASQASYISNKPVRNDDPKARQIEDLKEQVRKLTSELAKANDTIDFLNKLTQDNAQQLQSNFESNNANSEPKCKYCRGEGEQVSESPDTKKVKKDDRPDSAGSAVTEKRGRNRGNMSASRGESSRHSRESSLVEHRQIITQRIVKDQEKVDKFFKEKADQLKNIASYQRQQNPHQPHSAANESKDAITERIVHTLNMMKEVLQGNLSLRATIQRQSEQLDDRNAEIFQLSQENEDLRERLTVLEEYTGKDSLAEVQKLVREKRQLENRVKHLEQTSNNWTQFQKTRENFNKKMQKQLSRSSHNRTSQERNTATLDNQFDDDYEPVRPLMEHTSQFVSEAYYDEEAPSQTTAQSKTKQPLIRSVQSNQKVGYDTATGEKVFKVTTNQKQKNMNMLNKQRAAHQGPQAKAKNQRAPLPHAQPTDRSRVSRGTAGSVPRNLAKTRAAKQQPSRGGGGNAGAVLPSGNQLIDHEYVTMGQLGKSPIHYGSTTSNSQHPLLQSYVHNASAESLGNSLPNIDQIDSSNKFTANSSEMHKRMAHTGFNLKKDGSSTSIGRERSHDLNMTVDDARKKNQATMHNFTHSNMLGGAGQGAAFGSGKNAQKFIRKRQTNTAIDEDEPSMPLILQTEHNPMFSPESQEQPYDLIGSPVQQSAGAQQKQGNMNVMKNSSKSTKSNRLPPRSPNKYSQSQQVTAMKQRQQPEHPPHPDDVANEEVAYIGARAEVMQLMEQRDKMQKQVQEMLREEERNAGGDSDEQSYYDEEDDQEIDAQIREPQQHEHQH